MLGMEEFAINEQERIDYIVKESSHDIMKLYLSAMMIHDTNIDEDVIDPLIRPIVATIGEIYGSLFMGLRDEYHDGYISKQDITDYFIYIMMKTTEYVNQIELKHEEIRKYVMESIANYNTQAMMLVETQLDISEYERVGNTLYL